MVQACSSSRIISAMGKRKRSDEGAEDGENQTELEAIKTSQVKAEEGTGKSYEELVALVSVIAQPLASRKLTKRLYKITKKAKKAKKLKRGVREVVKGLRKNEKGLVVLAGDVSPIDVISHIPVYCEEKGIPYCYVPSRKELGCASGTQRPTSVVLVQTGKDYEELYQDCHSSVDGLPLPL